MEVKPTQLVKAVYDFPTDDDIELSLQIGDIVQIQNHVDRQWSYGVCGSRRGNFPIGFTVDMKLPQLMDHQHLFAVTSDFGAQEKEDLALVKGDLVIGHNPVDSNWWYGEKLDGSSGIFPVTHVWKIDKSTLPATNINKKMFVKARVKINMTAQLPEEMDLFKGEIVNIMEEVEKGWYRGECNGCHGIFPASFVTILPDSSTENSLSVSSLESTPRMSENYESKYGYDCINSGITPYGRALYPFQAEYSNELSLSGGEIVNLKRHIDNNWIEGEVDGKTGIFPASFINIIVDCPEVENKLAESNNTENDTNMNTFPPDTYGRVICDFYPQLEGDVRLKEGDTVTLIRKIDENWYEVETDGGDAGVCPKSYIEVIGSGPPSYNEVMASVSNYKLHSMTFDTDCSFFGNSRNKLKSNRPLSFASSTSDSSFSSQNSASDKNLSKGVPKLFDNKVAANLIGLDSLLSSDTLHDSHNSSYVTYDNILGRRCISSKGVDFLPSTYDCSPRHFTLESVPSPKLTERSPNNLTACMSENEIQVQVKDKEKILKQRIICLNKLECEMTNSYTTNVSSEIRIQISQLKDDIDRLKREIESLNSKLKPNINQMVSDQCRADEDEMQEQDVDRKKEIERRKREKERDKMKEQRECIITEILQTERDYVSDLRLLQDTFLSYPGEVQSKGINVMALFGNLDEVINVADRLLRRLQKVSNNNNPVIGECFVDISDEMKEVYGHYCRNHDEANSVLDKIDFQSPAGQFINHKLEILKRQTNVFDLGAMLIKPVQRILKYPLLLDQLLKCTEDDHPDKEKLKQAIGMMSDVATAINEFKRQKDLVFKYRKQSDTSLSGRISKFNLHSMAKKSSRFGMRLSSSIGLKTVTVDQSFEKFHAKFNAIKKTLKIFLEDLGEYTKKSEELYTCAFNIAEGIAELYQERKSQQEVDQFRTAHRIILTQFWESFKQTMEHSIQSPTKQLLLAYRGPKNLIQKRYDKLLDFESSTSKMEKNKDVTKIKLLQDTQQMDKNNYEALNSQLLNDLPKLCDLSIDILCDCIQCFLKAKKNFIGKTAKHMISLMDLPLMLGNQGADILETFQVKHTLVLDDLSQLSIAYKQFQSCIKSADTHRKNPSPKSSRLNFGTVAPVVKLQTPAQKTKVKSKYPEPELYTACENFDAVDIMDVSLKQGDVVGVLKQQHPMGNKMRWFVDIGDSKGFVPAKCLMKYISDFASFTTAENSWNIPTSCINNSISFDITNASTSTNGNQKLYSKSQKVVSQHNAQTKQNDVVQPSHPVHPITSSLRMVAPSQYPLISQSNIHKPKENSQKNIVQNLHRNIIPNSHIQRSTSLNGESMSQNSSQIISSYDVCSPNLNVISNEMGIESIHRYEEILDSTGNEQNILLSDVPSTTAKSTPNILNEFDPYSSGKLPEMYDNIPDNLNSLCSSHRYEDIPNYSIYDEITDEAKEKDSNEYYYGLYDFTPTGPNQLSLRKGQVMLVLHKCDLNQNSEWWFVEDRHGNKGYVPGLYLSKYSNEVA